MRDTPTTDGTTVSTAEDSSPPDRRTDATGGAAHASSNERHSLWSLMVPSASSVGRFAMIAMLVTAGVVGSSGSAAAASTFSEDEMEFCGDGVSDRVDRDGDGYLSSFEICTSADTMIKESPMGKKDIPASHPWNVREGHPKFAYFGVFEENGSKRSVFLGTNEVSPSGARAIDLYEVGLEEGRNERSIFLDDHELREIEVMYVESDSNPLSLVLKDVDTWGAVLSGTKGVGKGAAGTAMIVSGAVPAGISTIGSAGENVIAVGKSIDKSTSADDRIDTDVTGLADPIKLEKPSDDRLAAVRIDSNVDGATVRIDGERVGTTPYSGKYPVDDAERSGTHTVTVDKIGYETVTRQVRFEPPETIDVSLQSLGDSSTGYEGLGRMPDGVHDNLEQELQNRPNGSIIPRLDGQNPLDVGPFASITASTNQSLTGERIAFDAGNSLGSDLTYAWDFGPSATGQRSDPTVEHSYANPGRYNVTLTVTDGDGDTDRAHREIAVTDAAPNASFVAAPQQPSVGETVTLNAAPSSDREGSIGQYQWDLDGDGSQEERGQSITHAFGSTGTAQVSLTVVDAAGNRDSVTKSLDVESAPETPDGGSTNASGVQSRQTETASDSGSSVDSADAPSSQRDGIQSTDDGERSGPETENESTERGDSAGSIPVPIEAAGGLIVGLLVAGLVAMRQVRSG